MIAFPDCALLSGHNLEPVRVPTTCEVLTVLSYDAAADGSESEFAIIRLNIKNSTIVGEAYGIKYKGIPMAVVQYDPHKGKYVAWVINGERLGAREAFRSRNPAFHWVKSMILDTWMHTVSITQNFPD